MVAERRPGSELAKYRGVYEGICALVDERMGVLPPEVAELVSDVTFAFFMKEAPVNVVRVINPLIRDPLELELVCHKPRRNARYALHPNGQMDLQSAFGNGAAAQSSYASPQLPLGGELGPNFAENFGLYHPLLIGSRAAATIDLTPPSS